MFLIGKKKGYKVFFYEDIRMKIWIYNDRYIYRYLYINLNKFVIYLDCYWCLNNCFNLMYYWLKLFIYILFSFRVEGIKNVFIYW